MMRAAIFAVLVLGLCTGPTLAQGGKKMPETDQTLYKQFSTGGEAALTALNHVVQNSETVSAPLLYTASGNAFKASRLEDAAFLFYVAQLRGRFDREAFPPKGQGGDSPMTLLGALSSNMGQAINPAIMGEPLIFKNVLARVEAWEPKTPKGYSPGWEYTKAVTTGGPKASHETRKKDTLKSMRGLSTLLSDAEYFKGFRLVQRYNGVAPGTRPSEAEYHAAVARLEAIEKEKKIAGPFTAR